MSYEVTARDEKRKRMKFVCDSPSLTKQSMKKECDINNIMKKYIKYGKLPDMIKQNPSYGDYSEVTDFQSAINIVNSVKEKFANLSGQMRKRFANDPAKFLEFVNDEENLEEMYELGLAIRPEEPNSPPESPGSPSNPPQNPPESPEE